MQSHNPCVISPKEEFRRFALSRIEGLSMTEEPATIDLYREALELGLARLTQKCEVPSANGNASQSSGSSDLSAKSEGPLCN